MSISSDANASEASSASAESKNRLRGSVWNKRRSTRRSLAACLATGFEVHVIAMTSNPPVRAESVSLKWKVLERSSPPVH